MGGGTVDPTCDFLVLSWLHGAQVTYGDSDCPDDVTISGVANDDEDVGEEVDGPRERDNSSVICKYVGFTKDIKNPKKNIRAGDFTSEYAAITTQPKIAQAAKLQAEAGSGPWAVNFVHKDAWRLAWDLMYPSFHTTARTGMHVTGHDAKEAGVQSVLVGVLSAVAGLLGRDVELRREAYIRGTHEINKFVRGGPIDFVFALAQNGSSTFVVEAKDNLEKPGFFATYVDQMCLELRAAWEMNSPRSSVSGMLMDGVGCVVFNVDATGGIISCSRYLHVFNGDVMPGQDIARWILCVLEGAMPGCSSWASDEWIRRHDVCVGQAARDRSRASGLAEVFSLQL